MVELPPSLAPWAPQLAVFPDEIALCLGQLASRVAGALGSWPRSAEHRGEPDGFAGLARRGSYQHLLPAEWLLLDELPEEFLRRVVSHEHSFLAPGFRQLAGGRRCLVALDPGPEQLGAPRIGQLALLIALAQRAAGAGAIFEWTVLGRAPLLWHDEVSRTSVLSLVQSRSAHALPSQALEGALAEIERRAADAGGASECWCLGGPTATDRAAQRAFGVVTTTDALDPAAPHQLRIVVAAPGAVAPRQLALELPPERLAVQLLRDPFAARPAPVLVASGAHSGARSLVFSADRRRLYYRGHDQSLVSVYVPNSANAAAEPPVTFPGQPDSRLIAAGRANAQLSAALYQRGDELFVHHLSRRGATSLSYQIFRPVDAGDGPMTVRDDLRPLALLPNGCLYFVDDRRDLFALHDGLARRVDQGVLALRPGVGAVTWLTYRDDELLWTHHPGHAFATERRNLCFGDVDRGLLGATRHALFAALSEGMWTVRCAGQPEQRVSQPPGYSVYDVISPPHETPALLALDPQRRRVFALGEAGLELLCSSSSPIATLTADGEGQVVAYLTEAGEIALYSCRERRFWLHAGGSAPA